MQTLPEQLYDVCPDHGLWFDRGGREVIVRALQDEISRHRAARAQPWNRRERALSPALAAYRLSMAELESIALAARALATRPAITSHRRDELKVVVSGLDALLVRSAARIHELIEKENA